MQANELLWTILACVRILAWLVMIGVCPLAKIRVCHLEKILVIHAFSGQRISGFATTIGLPCRSTTARATSTAEHSRYSRRTRMCCPGRTPCRKRDLLLIMHRLEPCTLARVNQTIKEARVGAPDRKEGTDVQTRQEKPPVMVVALATGAVQAPRRGSQVSEVHRTTLATEVLRALASHQMAPLFMALEVVPVPNTAAVAATSRASVEAALRAVLAARLPARAAAS
jgi:hypothetical protein